MLTDCQLAPKTQASLNVSPPSGYGVFFCSGPLLQWSARQLINQRQELSHPSIQARGRLPVEHFKRQSRSIQQPLKSTESRISVNDLTGKRPPAVNQLECHIPNAWHMPWVRNVYRAAVHSELSARNPLRRPLTGLGCCCQPPDTADSPELVANRPSLAPTAELSGASLCFKPVLSCIERSTSVRK